MIEMTPRQRRLLHTYEAMQALAQRCMKNAGKGRLPKIEYKHNGEISYGEYPDIYDITLRVKGMKNQTEEQNEHHFAVYLPVNYPIDRPIIKWNSPIFHPNILGMLDPNDANYQRLRQEFTTDEEMARAINQDDRWATLLESYVCLDALKENWTPSIGLDVLVVELANMIRYRTYNVDDPLNKAAAVWAKEKEKTHSLPFDSKGLVDVEDKPTVRIINVTRME